MPPCDPEKCVDHKAHAQSIVENKDDLKEIKKNLGLLLDWKAEMKGMWLLTVILGGFLAGLGGIATGAAAVYALIHSPGSAIHYQQGCDNVVKSK